MGQRQAGGIDVVPCRVGGNPVSEGSFDTALIINEMIAR